MLVGSSLSRRLSSHVKSHQVELNVMYVQVTQSHWQGGPVAHLGPPLKSLVTTCTTLYSPGLGSKTLPEYGVGLRPSHRVERGSCILSHGAGSMFKIYHHCILHPEHPFFAHPRGSEHKTNQSFAMQLCCMLRYGGILMCTHTHTHIHTHTH